LPATNQNATKSYVFPGSFPHFKDPISSKEAGEGFLKDFFGGERIEKKVRIDEICIFCMDLIDFLDRFR